MIAPKESFPLCWPDGWKRTDRNYRRWAKFKNNTLGKCCDECLREVGRLGGSTIVISTNIKPRLDGRPYANQSPPADPGVAVYFVLDGKPVSLACDKWLSVEDNLWAIVKHIEALRGQERWGVGSIARAFAGYTALPGLGQTSGMSWWDVLGVPINANEEQVKDAYHALAKKHHPDVGSEPSGPLFSKINDAYRMATSQRQGP
jgi:hypothetical protein